jgi:hypothetical protein
VGTADPAPRINRTIGAALPRHTSLTNVNDVRVILVEKP